MTRAPLNFQIPIPKAGGSVICQRPDMFKCREDQWPQCAQHFCSRAAIAMKQCLKGKAQKLSPRKTRSLSAGVFWSSPGKIYKNESMIRTVLGAKLLGLLHMFFPTKNPQQSHPIRFSTKHQSPSPARKHQDKSPSAFRGKLDILNATRASSGIPAAVRCTGGLWLVLWEARSYFSVCVQLLVNWCFRCGWFGMGPNVCWCFWMCGKKWFQLKLAQEISEAVPRIPNWILNVPLASLYHWNFTTIIGKMVVPLGWYPV